jgi:hydroxypyruvate isomerase
MPQFAANLSLLYPELDFLDRFEAAARDGFTAVEFLFPYAYPAAELAARLQAHGLQQVLFNVSPGHWDAGERGLAALPGREAEFQASLHQALAYAAVLNCPRLHVMAGIMPADQEREALAPTYYQNLRWAAALAAQQGVELLIEPLNTRDTPRYFLNRQDHAHEILDAVNAPNLKVQMDLYHCQIVEGDVAMKLRKYLPTGRVSHIQIAGVPERQEPDSGELNYPYLLQLLDELGYAGWVGCEYRPRRGAQPGATSAGLRWLQTWK